MWENSECVVKQLEGIGKKFSEILMSSQIKSFNDLESTGPRKIEMLLGRNPPFGNQLIENSQKIPKFKLELEIVIKSIILKIENEEKKEIMIMVNIIKENNYYDLSKDVLNNTYVNLLIGNKNNILLSKKRICGGTIKIDFKYSISIAYKDNNENNEIFVSLISEYYGKNLLTNIELVWIKKKKSK
jgi:hypothetical protein